MLNIRLMKPYPIYKVVYEETVNDGKTHGVYEIYIKIAHNFNWCLLYTTSSKQWCELALKKIKEIFDIYLIHLLLEEDSDTYFPMFEVDGQVYKSTYVFPQQSCICGEQIEGNKRYAEFKTDVEKFDYIRSTVFFYNKGTVLVKANQMFKDGQLLYNADELKNLCEEINQDYSKLDLDVTNLMNYLKQKYADAEYYICDGYSAKIR